jgi:hypothetical protein
MAVADQPAELAIQSADEFRGYVGASLLVLAAPEAARLAEILPDDDHDILPTGEVYVSQVRYRRLLNAVLGPGQWALVPRGGFQKQGNTLCREYALVVRGNFVAESVGEAEFQPDNDRMTWATAAESCKSNALTRCCKDLGIASECWDKRWAEAWKERHAVAVWCKVHGKPKKQWRRIDAEPFWNEDGPAAQKPGGPPAYSTSTGNTGFEPGITSPAPAPEPISRAQAVRLFALAKERSATLPGVSGEEIVRAVLAKRGMESTKQITADLYDLACEAVAGWEPPVAAGEHLPGWDAPPSREPGEDDAEIVP